MSARIDLSEEQMRCMLEVRKILQSMEQKLELLSRSVSSLKAEVAGVKQQTSVVEDGKMEEMTGVQGHREECNPPSIDIQFNETESDDDQTAESQELDEDHCRSLKIEDNGYTKTVEKFNEEAVPIISSDAPKSLKDKDDVSHILLVRSKFVPTFLPPDMLLKFYPRFCKRQLWPPFHYMLPFSADQGGRFIRPANLQIFKYHGSWISKELGQQRSVRILLFLEFHLEDKVSLWGGGIDRPPVRHVYPRRNKEVYKEEQGSKEVRSS